MEHVVLPEAVYINVSGAYTSAEARAMFDVAEKEDNYGVKNNGITVWAGETPVCEFLFGECELCTIYWNSTYGADRMFEELATLERKGFGDTRYGE